MTHSPTLHATAGVCIILPLLDENKGMVFTTEQKGQILRGKVIDIGTTGFTDWGAKVPPPCKKGDIVWFLKYAGGYDDFYIDGVNYIAALFKDIRVREV